jgi:hypothetical protein
VVRLKQPTFWIYMPPVSIGLKIKKTARRRSNTSFKLVSSLAYSLSITIETAFSSETSVNFQRTLRHYIREDKSTAVRI